MARVRSLPGIRHALALAKGDLLVASGLGRFQRLAVGTDGQALQADSTQLNGVKWTNRSRVVSVNLGDTTVVNTAVETDIINVNLPATLAAGDLVILKADGEYLASSGTPTITRRIYIGGTTAIVTNALANAASANIRRWTMEVVITILATASQRTTLTYVQPSTASGVDAAINAGVVGAGFKTTTEDLSTVKALRVTTQHSGADAGWSDTCHVRSLQVIKA